jgi:hypothetical protein
MTMTVFPNPDGSYTVKCGDAEVTVGGREPVASPLPPPSPAPSEGDDDPWPEPDDNDGGVVAYLHVGHRRPQPPLTPFDVPLTELLPEFQVPPGRLARAIPGVALHSRRVRRGLLVLELHVPAGQPFDVEQLQEAARAVRGAARQVQLHIYVEKIDPSPLGQYEQAKLS